MKNLKNLAIIMLALTVSGCSATRTYQHGFSFEQNNLDTLKVGESDYYQALNQLGSPTTESSFGPKSIYYISYTSEKFLFLDPKIVEQRVLAIKFNNSDVIEKITEYTLDDANEIAFSESKTKIEGNTLGPIEQIMTNIGKFNKKQKQY